jgi:NTE family protein
VNSRKSKKKINIALQGAGAHGAFAWGVLDKFLEDDRVEIEGISSTSAGSMNAAVYAYGVMKGNEFARETLHHFWNAISVAGQTYGMVKLSPIEKLMGIKIEHAVSTAFSKMIIGIFPPNILNPTNFNPMRQILNEFIHFEELNQNSKTKLFFAATNVRSGKTEVFDTASICVDVILAGSCFPHLSNAVEIDSEHYWDGSFMGNPVLYPLIYHCDSRDILVVHNNPIERHGVPTSADDIANRVSEITFNTSLIKELRAIYFVQQMQNQGWIKDEFKDKLKQIFMHSLRADDAMMDLSVASRMTFDWAFLVMLRDRGRLFAADWLEKNFDHLNVRSSVDLAKEFM